MIVKNESKIIKRMFDSVVSIIDSYCICDTGSTDDTIEIIRTYFKDKNLPGEVFELPFKDFGYNRTKSLERAEKWGQYALLLDADMLLEISPKFNKSEIVLDLYHVKQKNSTLDYFNTRVVRTDRGIRCVGVTHEYYDSPPKTINGKLTTLEINDIGDGGAKGDKFERDIRLLRRGILEEPKNHRYYFYLANSYRDHSFAVNDRKESKKAIKWYKKRISFGGWGEELFMSSYEIGNIYSKIGQPEKAVYWWLEAYLQRPTRSESLYEVIKYYREKDTKHLQIATHFMEIARKIPYPKDDLLFIRKNVYDYLLEYEYSIMAYYLNLPIDYYKYLDLLGKYNYANVIGNYKFYTKRLSSLKCDKHTFNTMATLTGSTDPYYPSTPSIIRYHNGYLMNQRYVNYFIEPNGSYKCEYPITSFNRRMYLDHNFGVISQFDFDQLQPEFDRYRGIEDVKIFPHNGQILFLGTEQNLTNKHLSVAGGVYPVENETHALSSVIYPSPENANCEKNWCYLDHKGTLKVVYKWHPLTIGTLVDDRVTLESSDSSVPAFFKHLRGSSNGVTYGNEIWFVTHMVEMSSPRNYYHCIVILDKDTLHHKRNSILFKFEDSSIEYCLGMVVTKKDIVFGYSKMDRETIVCSYERPSIDQLIFP
jgi:glycosyltransferase involved in cell wall biosynthesis